MSSMFTRKSRQDVMLEAILTVECTLSMMKIDGIGVKESDGGFMTTIWDIYCRPATPGKVRIFWFVRWMMVPGMCPLRNWKNGFALTTILLRLQRSSSI